MKVTVLHGQNIYDLAKQYYGSVDGVKHIIADNKTIITDVRQAIAPGTILDIDTAPVNEIVTRQLKNQNIALANDDNYSFDVFENLNANTGGAVRVSCVIIAANKDVWVATIGHGIYRKVASTGTWINYVSGSGSLASSDIYWLYQDPDDSRIYAATANGVALFGSTWNGNVTTSDGLVSNACRWVGKYNGNFFVGTTSGLSKTANWSAYNNFTAADSVLNSSLVTHGFVDSKGDMWLSTGGGLSVWRLATSAVDLYTVAGGHLPSDSTIRVHESQGIIYVATSTAGVVIYDGVNWTAHDDSGPNAPNSQPLCFASNSLNQVYCGFSNVSNGVLSLIRVNDSWSVEADSSNSDLPNSSIECLTVDSEDNIWIGTKTAGLWYYNKNILING